VNKLCIDRRMGGVTRYYFGDERELMLVPNVVKQGVLFVGYRKLDQSVHLVGTAFLVVVPTDTDDFRFGYIVTAKHVIDRIAQKSTDKKIYLRANVKGGTAEHIEMDMSTWYFHPTDETVDVAVSAFGWFPPLEHAGLSVESFVTQEIIDKEFVDVGDDLFLVGLFRQHSKTRRNIPIIRVGNISAMPEEKINTKFALIDAYLIECRSIGGLSGSPVYLMTGSHRRDFSATNRVGKFYLLGLVHGHFDISKESIDEAVDDDADSNQVNMGIAIVIPATKILEVINQPLFIASRDRAIKERMDAGAASLDSA
jgi:hypothetical protein